MAVPSNIHTSVTVVVPGPPIPGNQAVKKTVLINPDGSSAGTVKKAAAQADSTATDIAGIRADFNALLAKLRSAGVIASS